MSSVLSDTPTQSHHLLTAVNDVLVKSAPFCNQSFFRIRDLVDVTDPATVDSLLQNAPDRVVNPISRKQAISFFLEIQSLFF